MNLQDQESRHEFIDWAWTPKPYMIRAEAVLAFNFVTELICLDQQARDAGCLPQLTRNLSTLRRRPRSGGCDLFAHCPRLLWFCTGSTLQPVVQVSARGCVQATAAGWIMLERALIGLSIEDQVNSERVTVSIVRPVQQTNTLRFRFSAIS